MSAAVKTCACGCGTPVRKCWVRGHTRRVPRHLWPKPEPVVATPCECGCGEVVETRFVAGHQNRGRNMEAVFGTAARNQEIRKRLESGESLADLALAYGTNRQRVEQIYRKARSQARAAVRDALVRGLLVRPDACDRCGKNEPIESHHPDYSQPLVVEWLCKRCHVQADRERRARRGEVRRAPNGPGMRRQRALSEARRRHRERERAAAARERENQKERRRLSMLRDLAEVAIDVGHTPTANELRDRLPYTPANFHQTFGSIARAQELAGLIPNTQGSQRGRATPLPPNYRSVVERLRDELRCAA